MDQTRCHHQNATTKTPSLQQPPNHAAILQQRPNHKPNPQASPRRYFFFLFPLSIAENIGVWTPDWRGGGRFLVRYKSRGIRGTKRWESLSSSRVPLEFLSSSSRVHLPVRVAVGVPLEFISRLELQLEFLAQFLPSSSPGSRFVGGGYWRRSRVVMGRSCSCSTKGPRETRTSRDDQPASQ